MRGAFLLFQRKINVDSLQNPSRSPPVPSRIEYGTGPGAGNLRKGEEKEFPSFVKK
jgi:hypothetical protein